MMDIGRRVRDGLETLGSESARNPGPVVAVVLVLVIVSGGVAATSLQMSMGMTLYIDDDSETAQQWAGLKDDFDTGNNVFVVVESDRLYDPETIRAIDRLDRGYSSLDETNRVVSLADLVRAGNGGEIPATETGVRRALDRATEHNPEMAGLRSQLVPESGTTIILVSYGDVGTFDRGQLLPQRGADIVYGEIQEETQLAALPAGLSVTVTGQPVFENAAFGLMLPEMITLFAGAFALIFGVVYLVMRSKVERGWHVFLPLGTAMTALVYMTGAMGVLGYNFNAIMLGVMPIALGLGIDYGLQIQTRYLEERGNGRDPVEAAGLATRTTGRALLIAMVTTVVGLGSLLVSSVPPVQQFGVTSAVSVAASMALAVTLLPAMLVRVDGGASHATADASGMSDYDRLEAATGAFTRRLTVGRPLVTLLLAALLVSGGVYAYPQVEPRQQMMDFWPQELGAKEDLEELEDTVEGSKVIYVVVETDQAYTPETFREVATYQRLMLENPNVEAVVSPVTAVQAANGGRIPDTQYRLDAGLRDASDGPTAIRDPSETPSKLLLTFYVDDVEGEPVRTLIDEFEGNADYTLATADEVQVTGKPVLNRNVIENVTAGLTPMTLLSFLLGFLVLAIAFRSLKISAVLITAVAGSAALLVTGAMYLIGVPWNPLTITMSSLTLGIGIDYGVHVFERFEYEVLERGQSRSDAAATAVAKLSRPVIGSSFTTIFGFGVLTISRFPVLANFGVTTVFAIALSLLAAFVILPAALVTVRLFDDRDPTPAADAAGS